MLHYTGMATAEAALERLCSPQSQVSAHYLIDERGLIFLLVGESRRAWHAGVSSWRGETDVNSHSIGVELAHPGHRSRGECPPFPEPQLRALERLLAAVLRRYDLPPEAVVAHSDVAPGRKIDPGERFDWSRLGRLNLGIASGVQGGDTVEHDPFWDILSVIGYGDWPRDVLLDAFRRRFRPAALGRPLEAEDVVRAAGVAARIGQSRQNAGGHL